MKKIPTSLVEFFSHSSDLPLTEGPTSRFVPWIIAFMIYLSCLVTVGMLLIQSSIRQWDGIFSRTLTIEVPYAADLSQTAQKDRLEKIQKFIEQSWIVESVQVIQSQKIEELLEPWLGKGNITDDLPLPTLIDVRLTPGHQLDGQILMQQLQSIAPGLTVEEHGPWRKMVIRLFKSGEYLGFWIATLILIATIMIITFSTHTELTIHKKIVHILQTVGAQDKYVAWQFQRHALHLGIQAALISLVLICLTFAALVGLFYYVDFELLKNLKFNPLILLSIPFVILFMISVMIVTARISSLKSLEKS